jgi:Arc/MetJ family transcription regulator
VKEAVPTVYTDLTGDIREEIMAKRLVDIEDGLLEEARQVLGTATIKETVAVALREAVRNRRRRTRLDDAALQRFSNVAADLGDETVMAAAWQ